MTTTQYLRAFARFWWIIALCVAGGLVLESAWGGATPSWYSSTASVQVTTTQLGRQTPAERTQSLVLGETRMPTYAAFVDNTLLAENVLKRVPDSGLSVTQFMDETAVRVSDYSTSLSVTARDPRSRMAHLLATLTGDAIATMITDYESQTTGGHALLQARLSDGGVTPARSIAPPAWRNATLFALAALLVGLALAVIAARLFPRLRDEKVVNELTGLPVLGVVPGGSLLATLRPDGAGYRRGVDELRTSLYFLRSDDACLTVGFTSPRPADRLSRVGRDVAEALTDVGVHVLLVDADLAAKSPSDGPGLAEYLEGSRSLDEVIQHDGTSGVDVIGAGASVDSPEELLHAAAFGTLLEHAQRRYAYVLVLAPATSIGTGAAAVAARCDATVVAVTRRTRARQLSRAITQLVRVEARVRGTLILA